MPGKTIKIISDQKNGRTPVYINGIGRDIPHNSEQAVTDDELAVLESSRVVYEVIGDAKAKAVAAAEEERTDEPNPTVSPQKPGGDHMLSPSPEVDEPVVTAPKLDQEPGGDNMTGGVIHGRSPDAANEQERAEAKEKLEAARDGTLPPVVELQNTDPNMLGLDANNPPIHGDEEVPLADAQPSKRRPLDRDNDGADGGSVSIGKILEGTVPEVLAKLDSLDAQQRAALKKAEKKGQNRSGILNNL